MREVEEIRREREFESPKTSGEIQTNVKYSIVQYLIGGRRRKKELHLVAL